MINFIFLQVPIHAAHLYDAVMIYARALTETFKEGEDPSDGTAIMKRILNRSYDSIQGYTVRKSFIKNEWYSCLLFQCIFNESLLSSFI